MLFLVVFHTLFLLLLFVCFFVFGYWDFFLSVAYVFFFL